MANKSSLDILIDNASGVTLEIQAQGADYMALIMTDGKNSLALKLAAPDMHILKNALMYADGLRTQIPTS